MTTSAELFAKYNECRNESEKADLAYSAALKAAYSKNAGDMRYRPDLQPDHIRGLGSIFVALSNRAGIVFNEALRVRSEERRAPSDS